MYPWTADLEAEAKAGLRSASRGLGPPKQSEPYPIEEQGHITLPEEPEHEDEPIG